MQDDFCHMLFFSYCLTLPIKGKFLCRIYPHLPGVSRSSGVRVNLVLPLGSPKGCRIAPWPLAPHTAQALLLPSTPECICWHCSGTKCLPCTAKPERMKPRDSNISTAAVARILPLRKRQRQDLVSDVYCRNR